MVCLCGFWVCVDCVFVDGVLMWLVCVWIDVCVNCVCVKSVVVWIACLCGVCVRGCVCVDLVAIYCFYKHVSTI